MRVGQIAKADELGLSGGVEASCGDARVDLPFSRQIARNVSLIFLEQRIRFVFRVSLREHKQAVSLFGKQIDAGVFGMAEYRITGIG